MTRIALLALGVFTLARAIPAEQTITGQWMIDPSPKAGKIQLTLHRSADHSEMTSTSDFSADQLRGLARPQMDSPSGAAVHFEIARNAGTLACEGFFRSGRGSGAFTFSPSQNFVSEMHSLGYNGLSTETVFSMAVHDVTSAYARDLRSLGIKPGSPDDLISMTIHGVSIEYIREMKDLGLRELTADHLVSMRIHDVTTEFVRDLKGMGYNPAVDELVSLRIHGATSEYVKQMKNLGLSATPDQLVSMRIHGVAPEFIHDLQGMGYHPGTDDLVSLRIHGATSEYVKQVKGLGFNPTLDQLVSMRIHGVTPEYIQRVKARGIKNLTIDQLVNLRIHGIVVGLWRTHSASSRREHMATCAPALAKRKAVAAPIPRLPPVTRQTLPSKFIELVSVWPPDSRAPP